MKIDFSTLRPVKLEDRKLFDEKLAIGASQSCECSFPNLFMYQEPYGLEFVEAGDRLVVYERKARTIHYPIGRWTEPAELKEINDAFLAEGLTDGGIYDVPEEFLDRHPECDDFFELEFDEGATKEEIPVVAKLAADLNSRLEPCEFLEEEALAMNRAWNNFDELGLGGIILYAEPDYPAGFSVYSLLPSDTVDVHYEKADHAVKGAPQTLTWQLAIALRGKAKFMNREQDMNEESLRHAKRSLDPERFFKRYFLRAK